eukprot:305509-Amphidinium_carterae.1
MPRRRLQQWARYSGSHTAIASSATPLPPADAVDAELDDLDPDEGCVDLMALDLHEDEPVPDAAIPTTAPLSQAERLLVLRFIYEQAVNGGIADTINGLCAEMKHSVLEHLSTQRPTTKKPYMSREAEALLIQRQTATEQNRHEDEKTLDRQFRKRMHDDKKQYMLSQLNSFDGPRQNWKGIKMLRSQYTPKVFIRGHTPISPQKLPEQTSLYFYQEHWKTPPHPRPDTAGHDLVPDDTHIQDSDFTMDELTAAITQLQTQKSSGPDE